MPDVTLTLKVAVTDGPTWSVTHTESVEAYDLIDVVIEPNTTDRVVTIQPGTASQLAMVAIQSTLYGPEIQFKVSDSGGDSAPVALLGPQFYGKGVTALFSVEPQSLKFSNSHPAGDTTKRARIKILVCRDATP